MSSLAHSGSNTSLHPGGDVAGVASHTPGPWEHIGTDPAEGWDGFRIVGEGMANKWGDIATVTGPQRNPSSVADARLIAAAPELLETLRHLIAGVTYADPPKDFGTPGDPVLCHEARVPVEFVTEARAIIAKASAPASTPTAGDGAEGGMNQTKEALK